MVALCKKNFDSVFSVDTGKVFFLPNLDCLSAITVVASIYGFLLICASAAKSIDGV